MGNRFARLLSALFIVLTWALGSGPAFAVADPDSVAFTLEGCRNDGSIALPNGSGKFVCPDTAYTTGNLGKGWNELDLVPFRITAKAGNSAPATQTYAVSIALDNFDAGKPGYDVLGSDAGGAPVLNTALSDASCTALTSTAQSTKTPGVGGIDQTIYRILTITQAQNTTCVYDWYGRLALGSHLFPGSSLHANLLNQNLTSAGIGEKDVSIPVKEISPQQLRKDMSATADSNVQWNLTKAADQTKVSFGNVCEKPGSAQSKTVTFRVEWIKVATTAGGVNFVTNIYAKNPASRTITVNVTDTVYQGTTQTVALDTASTPAAGVDVPANTELKVLTHSGTLPSSAGAVGDYLNDVATATYTDKATGIPVPGTTTATASAQIGAGVVTNAFAAIADSESITGTGLTFSVAQPAIGDFSGYTADTPTTGPVDWGITGETSGRYVDFVKTVYLDTSRVTSGTLTDTAVLVASPPDVGGFTKTAGPIDVAIDSSASVQLTVRKTIPPIQMAAGQRIEVTFRITRASDASYQVDKTLVFTSGVTSQEVVLSGLVPDSYTVTELSSLFWNGSAYVPSNLMIDGPDSQSKTLTAGADGVFSAEECAATTEFRNIPAGGTATAKVQKITEPAGDSSGDPWVFTLNGPGGPVSVNANSGAGPVEFPLVLQEGNYTVTETTKGPEWVLTGAAPDANKDKVCEFTVDYPADFGRVFTCTFYNQKQGKAKVVKTVLDAPPSGTQAFTFQLRQGASTIANGTTLETGVANAANLGQISFSYNLVPGNQYQLCEIVMPGWLSSLGSFVPASFMPPDGVAPDPNVDNSILCVNFTVTAGEIKTFTVNNTPPPGGRALTIGFWKNWASCAKSNGKQKPVLDQTLAAAEPIGIVVSATSGTYPGFGATFYLVLHGSTSNVNLAPDCQAAVNLLNKSTTDSGKKMASDPAFNLAAQLIAAELNYAAGAGKTGAATTAINQAVLLLGKYKFDGKTHTTISAADATTMNNLAKTLDDYNNNR